MKPLILQQNSVCQQQESCQYQRCKSTNIKYLILVNFLNKNWSSRKNLPERSTYFSWLHWIHRQFDIPQINFLWQSRETCINSLAVCHSQKKV